ncbi:hypothetical protein NDU88_004586 [Pleurodeles waltl]|uniref:Uncharacterized protein n=1 Tax=Pleurodeles waltl TaxID=8319 RepID=A0AAV7NK78_PLEWA|nr:hypothetical protein NDU88_004586 [Pleurodeles waltl]
MLLVKTGRVCTQHTKKILKVKHALVDAIRRPIDRPPKTRILGILEDVGGMRDGGALMALGRCSQKKDIAKTWRSEEAPHTTAWLQDTDWIGVQSQKSPFIWLVAAR